MENVGEMPRLVLVGESEVAAMEILKRAASSRSSEKMMLAADWLERYLSLGPRPATEIAEDARQSGIAAATLRRAKVQLGVVSIREGYGPGSRRISWTWKVGTRTTPGRWPITVSCGSAGTLHTSFVVT